MGNGMNPTKEKAWGYKSGQTAANTKAFGKKTRHIHTADLSIPPVIVTSANGNMTKHAAQGHFILPMAGSMLDPGKMTCNMDLELRRGLILPSMKAGLRMGKDIFLELSILLMEVNILESFLIIRLREWELMNGMIIGNFKDFGKLVR